MTAPKFVPDTESQRWWKSLPFGEQMVQSYNAPSESSIEAMYAIHLERSGNTPAPAPQGVDVPQMSLIEEYASTPEGAAELAEARKEIEQECAEYEADVDHRIAHSEVSMERAMRSLFFLGDNPQLEICNVDDDHFCARVVSEGEESPMEWIDAKSPQDAIYKAMLAWDERVATQITETGHAPQPEATPAPAPTDAGEVQSTTPKWPRYLMPRGGVDKKLLIKFTAPGIGGLWADGLVTQGLSDFDYYLKAGEHIETDADGNALTQPTEHQQASGVEECNTQLPADRASDAVTLARAAETSHPSQPEVAIEPQQASGVERYTISGAHTFDHSTYVTAADHDRVVAEKDAAIAEYAENLADTTHDLQDRVKELAERDAEIARLQDALDENWTTHQQIINARTVRNGEYDKLHAMLVAEQQEHGRTASERNALRTRAEAAEADLATSNREAKGWHGVVVECEKILKAIGTAEKPLTSNLPNLIRDRLQSLHRAEERAEAAEAKCAEYRDTFTATNEMRLSGVRLRQAVQQRAELAEMHCTEALDRLEVANQQLAELRAANERMRALLIKAKPLIVQPHDVSKPWVVNEIDAALAKPSAEVGE